VPGPHIGIFYESGGIPVASVKSRDEKDRGRYNPGNAFIVKNRHIRCTKIINYSK
jgi:hypothetical protein